MSTRRYTIRGDPEQMLAALRGSLPFGASLSGNSTRGAINVILSGKVVEYSRNGTDLTVTVFKGAGGKSEAEIWQMIENGLGGYV